MQVVMILVLAVIGVRTHAESEKNPPDKGSGFVPLFDGKSMKGWVGDVAGYEAKGGVLTCLTGKGKGGKIFTEKEYDNFIIRFEFNLTPGSNNGLALRCPLEGKPASKGFESQILDNSSKRYLNKKPSQYHGSLYKLVAAKRGFLKPVGEWNRQEVILKGNRIKITLNGEVILEDTDISRFKRPNKGHIGFLGHGSKVQFRKIELKELNTATQAALTQRNMRLCSAADLHMQKKPAARSLLA